MNPRSAIGIQQSNSCTRGVVRPLGLPKPANMCLMNRRQYLSALVVSVFLGIAAVGFGIRAQTVPDTLPSELSDKDFWSIVTDYSEPDGFFRSDNLVSNERTFQEVIPTLQK